MHKHTTTLTLSAFVLALGLLSYFATPAQAIVMHQVKKGSYFAEHFTVTKQKYYDELEITVTVPKQIDGEQFEGLLYSIDKRTRASTNGTELSLVIAPDDLEKVKAYASYRNPNHKPGETGGLSIYELNVSSLAVEAK